MRLNDYVSRALDQHEVELIGVVMGAPRLYRSDGFSTQYTADVLIENQTEVIRNVPIASSAGGQVQYAENGYAVTLRRVPGVGSLEIVGFSSKKPGVYRRRSVDVSLGTIGTVTNLAPTSRPLTLNELQSYGGGFGRCPLGAHALFDGNGTFVRLI